MKGEEILALFEKFEQAATKVNNVECWSARSICPLLGYTDWRNFMKAIEKAKESCISAGERELDHFVGVNKMVSLVFCLPAMRVTLLLKTETRASKRLLLLKTISLSKHVEPSWYNNAYWSRNESWHARNCAKQRVVCRKLYMSMAWTIRALPLCDRRVTPLCLECRQKT